MPTIFLGVGKADNSLDLHLDPFLRLLRCLVIQDSGPPAVSLEPAKPAFAKARIELLSRSLWLDLL